MLFRVPMGPTKNHPTLARKPRQPHALPATPTPVPLLRFSIRDQNRRNRQIGGSQIG
ncbi:hypothetical protein HanRHA438_Chr08g0340031 [Helianthus annuus]|nr:hypothetical protein HanRHA438_Chr08g0340031 [Helianthus annuus]